MLQFNWWRWIVRCQVPKYSFKAIVEHEDIMHLSMWSLRGRGVGHRVGILTFFLRVKISKFPPKENIIESIKITHLGAREGGHIPFSPWCTQEEVIKSGAIYYLSGKKLLTEHKVQSCLNGQVSSAQEFSTKSEREKNSIFPVNWKINIKSIATGIQKTIGLES